MGAGAAGAACWVRPEILAASRYETPPTEGLVKLDAMENPFQWPPQLGDAWRKEMAQVSLNRYPDGHPAQLEAEVRRLFELPADYGILFGNGSDEIIQMLATAVRGPCRALLTTAPSFSMYEVIARLVGLPFVGVAAQPEDFALREEAFLQALESNNPALVLLARPNNPTGRQEPKELVRRILEARAGPVVLDEAYAPFAGEDCLDLLENYENLLILRTFSKLGLAGLRIGFLVGHAAWIAQLQKVRLPYNVGVLTQITACFALRHYELLRQQCNEICRLREEQYQALGRLPGLQVWPSRANFLLLRTASSGVRVFEELRRRKVLVRCLHGSHPLLRDCLRVTVGAEEENHRLLEELGAVLGESKKRRT